MKARLFPLTRVTRAENDAWSRGAGRASSSGTERPRQVPAVRPVISARRWSRRWLRGDRGTVRTILPTFSPRNRPLIAAGGASSPGVDSPGGSTSGVDPIRGGRGRPAGHQRIAAVSSSAMSVRCEQGLDVDRPGGVVVVGGDQAPISQKHTRIGGVSNDTESPFGGNRFEV